MTLFEKVSDLTQHPKPQTDAETGRLSEENLTSSLVPKVLISHKAIYILKKTARQSKWTHLYTKRCFSLIVESQHK